MSDRLKPLIGTAATRPLTQEEAEAAFEVLFEGEATPAQMGGFLMALRTRGETVDEYTAAAGVMRAKRNAVIAPEGAIDIVGTGGDGKGTLNISTATAFVVAGAGVTVAKHGNRNLSSKSGSADALAEMGIKVMLPATAIAPILESVGNLNDLAPGLYEMRIDNPTGDPDCHKPQFQVRFEERQVEDLEYPDQAPEFEYYEINAMKLPEHWYLPLPKPHLDLPQF